jgi:hypothetical protein
MQLTAGYNQAVVKNNRYNWNLINDEIDDVITVEQESSDEMVIEFPSGSSKDANLPMFQT